jgi:hypothetical protein
MMSSTPPGAQAIEGNSGVVAERGTGTESAFATSTRSWALFIEIRCASTAEASVPFLSY